MPGRHSHVAIFFVLAVLALPSLSQATSPDEHGTGGSTGAKERRHNRRQYQHRKGQSSPAFTRIASVGSSSSGTTTASSSTAAGGGDRGSVLELDSLTHLINGLITGDVSQMDMLTNVLDSSGYKELLQAKNGDTLRKLLESFPMMEAIPDLKAAKEAMAQGALSDEQVATAFIGGMQEIIALSKDVFNVVADPNNVADIIKDLSADEDSEVSQHVRAASQGDDIAVAAVAKAFNEKAFPGLDTSVLDKMSDFDYGKQVMEGLWQDEDVMRQIDADGEVSKVMRNLVDYRQLMADKGYVPSAAASV